MDRGDGKTQQVGRCLFNLFIQKIPEKYLRPKFLGKDPFEKIWAETRWASRRVTPVKFIHFQQRTGGLVREEGLQKWIDNWGW